VQVTVLRGTTQEVFNLATEEEGQDMDRFISLADPGQNLVSGLGVLGVEIDKKTAPMLAGLRDPYGIVLTARVTGSIGDVPLVPGDVIRSLNTQPMTTLERLRTALKAISPGTPFVLQVQRDSKLMYIPIALQ
jgi:S1-C subfamily serine protease